MKHLLTAVLLSGAIALPAFAALKKGDAAPDFSAPASLDLRKCTPANTRALATLVLTASRSEYWRVSPLPAGMPVAGLVRASRSPGRTPTGNQPTLDE